ncbi:Hypothetical predicted protein [Octopus vulgaris]|uniref:Uncharacterized protein n=1 Tax=Octopus vulgaris TaxID=6645 RepID=A0AA36B2K9_OCTVU|nr:Hypothetical predicted protein [Octopus vulgaris]
MYKPSCPNNGGQFCGQLDSSADKILDYTGDSVADTPAQFPATVSPSSPVASVSLDPDSMQAATLQAILELTEEVKLLCAEQNSSPRQRYHSERHEAISI